MLKDTTYVEKMAMLNGWLETIIQEIKKDVKNDHLKKDSLFTKRYFPGKQLGKMGAEELAQGYAAALKESEQAEAIGEFIANRWLLKNTDLYGFFEEKLKKVCDDFDTLEELDKELSDEIIQESTDAFGAVKSYLFSVFNSVVFPSASLEALRAMAEEERERKREESSAQQEEKNVESLKKSYEQQIARLSDRYEKRLSGIERKYLKDTEALKRQVATLQKKLTCEVS